MPAPSIPVLGENSEPFNIVRDALQADRFCYWKIALSTHCPSVCVSFYTQCDAPVQSVVQICEKEEHRALYDLNEKEHVDALHLQIRAEAAVLEEVEVAEASVSVTRQV